MGMTIKESLSRLKELKEDYQSFCDEVWQDPDIHNLNAEALGVAIDIMEKYQQIEKIYHMWNEVNDFPLAMWNIGGVLDGNDD